jgi:hypothetical protein
MPRSRLLTQRTYHLHGDVMIVGNLRTTIGVKNAGKRFELKGKGLIVKTQT